MDKYGLRVPSAYEEEVRTLASLTNAAQALANPIVQNLMSVYISISVQYLGLLNLLPLTYRYNSTISQLFIFQEEKVSS